MNLITIKNSIINYSDEKILIKNIKKLDLLIDNLKKDYKDNLDLNTIIEKYNIHVKYKNKIIIATKIKCNNIKKRIIQFTINEPCDIFDYDYFIDYSLQNDFILKFFIK